MNETMRAMVENGTLSEQAYKQLIETVQEERKHKREATLFMVHYIENTVLALHYFDANTDEDQVRCQMVSAEQTKIMRGEMMAGWGKSEYFIAGVIPLNEDGKLYDGYKRGKQFIVGEPNSESSKYLTIYTILDIKPYKSDD